MTHLSPTSRCSVQTFKSVSFILTDSALSQAVEDVVLIGDKTTQSVAVVPEAIGLPTSIPRARRSWTSRLSRTQRGSKAKAVARVTSEMAKRSYDTLRGN